MLGFFKKKAIFEYKTINGKLVLLRKEKQK
jgi:hypothetical protein